MVEKGKAFFEISQSEFKKEKRGYIPFIIALIGVLFFYYFFWLYSFGRFPVHRLEEWGFHLIILSSWLIPGLPYLKGNQFGIYEGGISPPSEPMTMVHKKEVFIPYSDIINMDVDSKRCACDITLKNGKEINFNIIGWVAALYLRSRKLDTVPKIKKLWRILEFVRKELLKEENKIKMKNNLPIILDTSKYTPK